MKLAYILILAANFSGFSQSGLKFQTGDSILFNIRSYSCNSPGDLKQLLFVRNGDCVEVSKRYSDPENIIPVVTDMIHINWHFLKDSLSSRLKMIIKMKEQFSTDKTLLYVLNNGMPVTIKQKVLKVVTKENCSNPTCIYESSEAYTYMDQFYDSLEKGYKNTIKASCNYKPNKKMPTQGEN